MISDVDRDRLEKYAAYIAGLLDGEGCIKIHTDKRNGYRYVTIRLGMTHRDTIEFIAGIFGVSFKPLKKMFNRKIVYFLQVSTKKDIRIILETIWPWIITKREDIQDALEFLGADIEDLSSKDLLSLEKLLSIEKQFEVVA